MNRLSQSTSPYLLQHAHNPVDWYPWGEEALAKAKAEDKPIFLSIGYSACHWCHVLSHESFEDPETAAFMNENFINIGSLVLSGVGSTLDKDTQAKMVEVRKAKGAPLNQFDFIVDTFCESICPTLQKIV